MSPKLPNASSPSRESRRFAAFVSKKAEIDEMLTRLQALSDDHFSYSPDEIDWGLPRDPRVLRRAAEAGY